MIREYICIAVAGATSPRTEPSGRPQITQIHNAITLQHLTDSGTHDEEPQIARRSSKLNSYNSI
jgi:hypothetical protein